MQQNKLLLYFLIFRTNMVERFLCTYFILVIKGIVMSENTEVQVALQRIYVKDISFESPNAPELFQQQWQPKVNLDLQNKSRKLGEDVYEVSLELTAKVVNADKTAFIAEVEQAGIFMIKGITGDSLNRVMGTFCLNILFPYIRETIDGLCVKGSFPPLVLAPINFDQLFEQSQEKNNQ